MEWLVALLVALAVTIAAPWLHRVARSWTGWLLGLFPLALAIYLGGLVERIAGGDVLRFGSAWMPSLGIAFSFRLDGLSLLFSLLISGIGFLILVYTGAYLGRHPHLGRFYAYMLLFMASMLGVVLADNLITLFVFWELTSLSSYLLIGFDHERDGARHGALQALLVTGGGGLALLAGFLLLGQVAGALELSELLERGEVVRQHALYLPILLLICAGAFTKSAQFPFHFWLPGAMVAPTPASAYLHSATMVKGGVYLLARLHPVLAGTDAWFLLVTTVGAVTMLVGAYLALQHTDLKRILAYTTVSGLGILMFLLGLGTSLAVQAAVVFLMAHALYKGALFMVAGAVDHETGTRNVERLGGLWRAMPITASAAVLAGLSLAGFGPLLSFIGKEAALAAAWESRNWYLTEPALVITAALLTTAAIIVSWRVFFGQQRATPKQPHEAPLGLWLGPLALAATGLATGFFPNLVAGVITPAIAAVRNWPHPYPEKVALYLWHGFNAALLFSVISVALGVTVYLYRKVLRGWTVNVHFLSQHGPAAGYDWLLKGLFVLAERQTRFLQSGYLRYYLIVVLATVVALVGYSLFQRVEWVEELTWTEPHYYVAGLAALIIMAAIATARTQNRLAAVAFLGVVGNGMALLFVVYGAPDLAMTQFLIEALTVVLFVLVLYRLPRFHSFSSPATRLRDVAIASIVGLLVTILVLSVLHTPQQEPISQYFAAHSYPVAHGRNVVNVILVDFRALDTLGEITVLAVASVGIYALLKLRPEPGQDLS